jgi:hypothetical protein
MALNPTDDHHSILVPDSQGGDPVLRLPLALTGVTSYFITRKPSREEFELSDLGSRIEMTYDSPEWDPTDERFEKNEAAMVN